MKEPWREVTGPGTNSVPLDWMATGSGAGQSPTGAVAAWQFARLSYIRIRLTTPGRPGHRPLSIAPGLHGGLGETRSVTFGRTSFIQY
jgi:hypothetical protein